MAENLYEGMFLLDSGRFGSDPEGTAKQVIGILEKAGATVVAHRPWQDGKLAYEIAGRRKGLHYLTYFRMEGKSVDEVTRACKLNDVVLRHMIIKHPETLFNAMVAALTGETEASESGGESREASTEKSESKSQAEKPEPAETAK